MLLEPSDMLAAKEPGVRSFLKSFSRKILGLTWSGLPKEFQSHSHLDLLSSYQSQWHSPVYREIIMVGSELYKIGTSESRNANFVPTLYNFGSVISERMSFTIWVILEVLGVSLRYKMAQIPTCRHIWFIQTVFTKQSYAITIK